MALASLDARAPPPPLPASPPSKYYAKVVIKGKPHFAPFLKTQQRTGQVLSKGIETTAQIHIRKEAVYLKAGYRTEIRS